MIGPIRATIAPGSHRNPHLAPSSKAGPVRALAESECDVSVAVTVADRRRSVYQPSPKRNAMGPFEEGAFQWRLLDLILPCEPDHTKGRRKESKVNRKGGEIRVC